ncbi:MAG: YqgE/AlgH family protein [Pseudomonadota bacterium]
MYIMLNFKGLSKWLLGIWLALQISLCLADNANSIFLVASEKVQDHTFRRTVILVTYHKPGWPVGVIINRPDREVTQDNNSPKIFEGKTHFGGPVSPNILTFVFRGAEQSNEALPILPNIQMSNSASLLRKLTALSSWERNIRIYRGFSTWAKGQLEHEIARGDWLVIEADEKSIFDKDPALLWEEMHESASRKFYL